MKKVNTLYNYFTSPKGPKPADPSQSPSASPKGTKRKTAEASGGTPKRPGSKNRVKDKGKRLPLPPTPRRDKENLRKNGHQEKGEGEGEEEDEEAKKTLPVPRTDKKRNIDREDEDDSDDVTTTRKAPKRRRILVPEDNSEDSEDEFQPDSEEEALDESESASEGVSDEEDLEEVSEEETPKKKKPRTSGKKPPPNKESKPPAATTATSKPILENQSSGNSGTAGTETWPHLKYDFLQPGKIRDANRRRPDDPEYDPRSVHVPQEFLNKQTPAMRQWWELKSKHLDCVLFFKVGKFYELYHMDAVTGVQELNLTFMRGEFAHSGFPEIAYGRFSSSLIEKGFKVARVEQTENPEMMSKRCSQMTKASKFDKVVKREICQISSRGTRVYTAQDGEASTPNSNYLLAICESSSGPGSGAQFGVCFVDTSIAQFHLGQFQDDRCHSRLLTLLAHYPPAHVLYERGNLSPLVLKILSNLLTTSIKEPLHRGSQFWSAEKTLKTILEGEYFKPAGTDTFAWPEGFKPFLSEGDSLGLTAAEGKELAVSALGACIYLLKDYLLDQQLLAQARFRVYQPVDNFFSAGNAPSQNQSLPTSMMLDAITINNLRILGSDGSLLATLDRCCTSFGKRLLREWVCRPSCRKSVIEERQKAITELVGSVDVTQEVRAKMAGLPDLERLLSKIHSQGNAAKMWNHPDGRAIMFEGPTYSKRIINDFLNTLNGFEQALGIMGLLEDMQDPLLERITRVEPAGEFPDLSETLQHFKEAFDHETAKKEGRIIPKKGLDTEYDSVMEDLDVIAGDLERYLKQQRNHFGVKVNFVGSDRKRYQLEVPESQEKKVGPGYELQSQRKGFKRYYTAEARELLSRQINAEEQRDKVLKDLNRRVFAKFSEKYETWNAAVHRLATLDVLLSLADYARSVDTCVPQVLDGDQVLLDIQDGRHPSMASGNFIPNDTKIGADGAATLLILTGPNMGGKSTLMRQVGLILVMAQIGSHVPATSCRFTLTDRIFTRLGANDDIVAGQSTFFVELSETAAILQHATPYSLVLLDELGRGTSTYDGTAIAAAVVEKLTQYKCRTIFSTHYHSLVEDYKSNNNVALAHMACMVESENEEDISEETVTFLYKLAAGACPKSYGFNAARLAGIPASITKYAHQVAVRLESAVREKARKKSLFVKACRDETSGEELKEMIAALRNI